MGRWDPPRVQISKIQLLVGIMAREVGFHMLMQERFNHYL